MAYGPRKKDELLEEYAELEPRVYTQMALLRMRRGGLRAHQDAIDAVADLSWLRGSRGTALEQQRIAAILEMLKFRRPGFAKLLERVRGYQRWSSKETWNRPGREHWERLVNDFRREMRSIVRTEQQGLDHAWAAYNVELRRFEKMRGRLHHLERILGDEILTVEPRW